MYFILKSIKFSID